MNARTMFGAAFHLIGTYQHFFKPPTATQLFDTGYEPMNRDCFDLTRNRSRRSAVPNGFTLMELLIVISIILILMLMAIPTIGVMKKHANEISANTVRARHRRCRDYVFNLLSSEWLRVLASRTRRRTQFWPSNTDRRPIDSGRSCFRLQIRLPLQHNKLHKDDRWRNRPCKRLHGHCRPGGCRKNRRSWLLQRRNPSPARTESISSERSSTASSFTQPGWKSESA